MTLGKRYAGDAGADTSNIDAALHAVGAHDTADEEPLEAQLRKLIPAHANWKVRHESNREVADHIASQVAEAIGGHVTGVVDVADEDDHPPVYQVVWSTPGCVWLLMFHQHDPQSGLYRLHVDSQNSEYDETHLRRSSVTAQQAVQLLRDNGVLPA